MTRDNPIRDKSYAFALDIIGLHKILIHAREYDVARQLLKSGTSIGANVREGLQGQSKRDFVAKFSIALKEAHECLYWLMLIRDSGMDSTGTANAYISKANELIRILTAIIKTSRS